MFKMAIVGCVAVYEQQQDLYEPRSLVESHGASWVIVP